MLEQTIHSLLAGQFICEFRHPDLYAYLQDADQRARVAQWVEGIGYKLSRLGDHGAYFMAYKNVSADRRADVRKQFKEIKVDQAPRITFLKMAQEALENDILLTPGSLIELPSLVDKVGSRPKLMEDFKSALPQLVGSRVSTSLHDNLKRALDGLCSDGYLTTKNAEREIYMVTGKIDYLHNVIDFLLDNEPLVTQDTGSPQMDLEAGDAAAGAS